MSDHESFSERVGVEPSEQSKASRAYGASPLGVAALVAGIVLAIVFLLRFNALAGAVNDGDLKSAIQALQITVVAVWLGVALWGWYLIRDGMERANTNRRLHDQDLSLSRIEQAISEIDREKEQVQQKSRSFWDWRRGETS
jgi:membrane protein implicated in regulation of membrane protease activity